MRVPTYTEGKYGDLIKRLIAAATDKDKYQDF